MRPKTLVPVALILTIVAVFFLLARPDQRDPGVQPPPPEKKPRTPAAARPQEPARMQVFYLFDVSGSIHTGAASSPFSRVVPLLERSVNGLGHDGAMPSPQLHRVGTISGLSLNQSPLCEIFIAEATLFVPSDTAEAGQEVKECEARLLRLPPDRHTDISGAIKFASLALQGGERQTRVILVFTDLEENLGSGQEPGIADLAGVCVAVFYEITGDVPWRPGELDARIREWGTRFKSWGAVDTLFRHAAAFSAADLGRFIRGCKR